MLTGDDIAAARQSAEHIPPNRCFRHRHDLESVKNGFNRFDRIDLGNNNIGAQTFGPHSHALAAPAVTGHDYGLARYSKIGGSHNTVPC